jgi:hypothetical protein
VPIVVAPPTSTDLIATSTDLGMDLTTEEAALVDDQIALYQSELEAILGRAVTNRTHTQTATWPVATERFSVSGGPITSVTSVTVNGVALTTTEFAAYRDSLTFYTWSAIPGAFTVTYVGGWDAPRNLPAKSAVIGRTRRWWNKRADDDEGTESSSVEGHTVKWMPDAFTVAELNACERLRAPDMAG